MTEAPTEPVARPTVPYPAALSPEQMAQNIAGYHAYEAAEAAMMPKRKAAIFETLTSLGVGAVTVTFSGSSDSGSVEDIVAVGEGDATVSLAKASVMIPKVAWGRSK